MKVKKLIEKGIDNTNTQRVMTTTQQILTTFTSKVEIDKEYTRGELAKMLTEVFKEIREGGEGKEEGKEGRRGRERRRGNQRRTTCL